MFCFRIIHGQQRLVGNKSLLLYLILTLQRALQEIGFHLVHHTLTFVHAEVAHLLQC